MRVAGVPLKDFGCGVVNIFSTDDSEEEKAAA